MSLQGLHSGSWSLLLPGWVLWAVTKRQFTVRLFVRSAPRTQLLQEGGEEVESAEEKLTRQPRQRQPTLRGPLELTWPPQVCPTPL